MAEAIEDYPSGGYHACHGGARCRGTLIKIFDTDQYDRGDADTPKRLRRENVESSPPVAGARVGAPGGAAGEDAWSMVGTDRKAGHASLLWESVIAHLGLGVRPRWPPDTRDDHDLAAVRPSFDGRCARSSDCATDEGL
jgi:hypothetical protein